MEAPRPLLPLLLLLLLGLCAARAAGEGPVAHWAGVPGGPGEGSRRDSRRGAMAGAGEGSEGLGPGVGQAPHLVCGASSGLGPLLREGFLVVRRVRFPLSPLRSFLSLEVPLPICSRLSPWVSPAPVGFTLFPRAFRRLSRGISPLLSSSQPPQT